MVRFNYIIAILGAVGQVAAIYPRNAVMQDIFFGIFCMGIGMIGLKNCKKLCEGLGINPEIPDDKTKEKRPIIMECIFIVAAVLAEVALYLFHLPYTYTSTVIAVIAIIMVSRAWRGKPEQTL